MLAIGIALLTASPARAAYVSEIFIQAPATDGQPQRPAALEIADATPGQAMSLVILHADTALAGRVNRVVHFTATADVTLLSEAVWPDTGWSRQPHDLTGRVHLVGESMLGTQASSAYVLLDGTVSLNAGLLYNSAATQSTLAQLNAVEMDRLLLQRQGSTVNASAMINGMNFPDTLHLPDAALVAARWMTPASDTTPSLATGTLATGTPDVSGLVAITPTLAFYASPGVANPAPVAVTPLPEPATACLFGLGVLLLLDRRHGMAPGCLDQVLD